jgi:hypothetical protein
VKVSSDGRYYIMFLLVPIAGTAGSGPAFVVFDSQESM